MFLNASLVNGRTAVVVTEQAVEQTTHTRRIELSSGTLDLIVILLLVSGNLHAVAVTHPTLSKGTAQKNSEKRKRGRGEEKGSV